MCDPAAGVNPINRRSAQEDFKDSVRTEQHDPRKTRDYLDM